MGEATYYGKLVFDSAEHASAAYEPFKALCLEIYKSGEYWQDNRGSPPLFASTKLKEMTDEEFWTNFETQFPNAAEYLKSCGNNRFGDKVPVWRGDRNNGLAGLLEPIGMEEDVDQISIYGELIQWSSTVWHFAEWDPFLDYVKQKFKGCVRVGYASDEYTDYFETIGLR
jgi:hypothetical protein